MKVVPKVVRLQVWFVLPQQVGTAGVCKGGSKSNFSMHGMGAAGGTWHALAPWQWRLVKVHNVDSYHC